MCNKYKIKKLSEKRLQLRKLDKRLKKKVMKGY